VRKAPNHRFAGRQFPDAGQELILRAALEAPQTARRAWELWRQQANLDHLDSGTNRLLPLVYRNLGSHYPEDATLGNLRGVYLKTWSQNRLRFRALADLIRRFESQSIDIMVLKGGALIALAYRDFGVRPMADFDLLVRPESAREAIERLRQWGWKPSLDHPELLTEIRHGEEFVGADGQSIDLHWNLLQECCAPGSNEDFWNHAIPCEIDGIRCKALCPADQLLHVIVHGARWSLVQPVGWVADAFMTIKAARESIDWERLMRQVRSRGLLAPVRPALEYLRVRMDAQIPESVVEELGSLPVPFLERLEHGVKVRPRPLVGTLPVLAFDYLRLSRGRAPLKRMSGFVSYLKLTLGCSSLPELAASTAHLVSARWRAYLRMRSTGAMPPPRLRGLGPKSTGRD
jgi:hypothetical protein